MCVTDGFSQSQSQMYVHGLCIHTYVCTYILLIVYIWPYGYYNHNYECNNDMPAI